MEEKKLISKIKIVQLVVKPEYTEDGEHYPPTIYGLDNTGYLHWLNSFEKWKPVVGSDDLNPYDTTRS